MHFSSGINRPPYEANDEFLQITSGCSHGSCKFCTFYKDSPFSLSPMEEIEADIKELAYSGWGFDRIYLQGADPFIRKTEDLLKIAEMIYHYLFHKLSTCVDRRTNALLCKLHHHGLLLFSL